MSNTLNKWEHLGPAAFSTFPCYEEGSCDSISQTLLWTVLVSSETLIGVAGEENKIWAGLHTVDTFRVLLSSWKLTRAHLYVKRHPEGKKQVCLHLAWLFPIRGPHGGHTDCSRQWQCPAHVRLALPCQCPAGPHATCWHLFPCLRTSCCRSLLGCPVGNLLLPLVSNNPQSTTEQLFPHLLGGTTSR